jgi:mRNA interferase MazF
MIKCKYGGIVLINFGFSEGIGFKKRPALVISSEAYHAERQEVVILAITSNVNRIFLGDTKISEWKEAGLLYPSLVTAIIRTVKSDMIFRKIGEISQVDLNKVNENVRKIIGGSLK